MMYKNRGWFYAGLLALTGIFAGTPLFALSLDSLLPEDTVRQLVQNTSVNRERFDTPALSMVPRHAGLEKLIDSSRRNLDPNIAVESLQLYKKPGGTGGSWTPSERVELYNGITALSTLKGLEYFSKRRNKMRLLYETSVVVDGPETKNPQADPVSRVPPGELSVYVRQKDLSFGDNVYKYTYYAEESSFIVFQENMTKLNYGIVPVVDKNCLNSVVAIFDCGPYLLIYTASLAKASIVPGMKQRAGESISNRAAALLTWFSQKAGRAFGKTGS